MVSMAPPQCRVLTRNDTLNNSSTSWLNLQTGLKTAFGAQLSIETDRRYFKWPRLSSLVCTRLIQAVWGLDDIISAINRPRVTQQLSAVKDQLSEWPRSWPKIR